MLLIIVEMFLVILPLYNNTRQIVKKLCYTDK